MTRPTPDALALERARGRTARALGKPCSPPERPDLRAAWLEGWGERDTVARRVAWLEAARA